MADDSLIEEMRAAIRGDRERAEERRRREPGAAVEHARSQQVAVATEPMPGPDRPGRLRWLQRRRNHEPQ